ncbi:MULTISPECIES: hypothetical protein [Alcaligenaceae]|uniref:Uncharacterized protein n=2 Tax=Alcaligenaceae TaxID=506 RepID=A0A366HCQ7_9BURK|nr:MULTISPECIES: hypothetical protein [Alcaligenaceae]MCI2808876.1 hypothetical protein [Eoetvoesiella caeni]NYT36335.1 hypothetical protein [Allopusillimonas soli]NYT55623.1 hypothetical protein [Eoetvoesiella caeni]RBP40180.1 hypothetical protein DFR37_104279 [Eoetvoesiella caeni]TEA76654.1 hypothetical protein ERD78_05580 [Allopusillimonas soli]
MESHSNSSGARTKLDLLYHEVLGEVAGLVDRLESTTQSLDAVQKQMQSMGEAQQVLPEQLSRHLIATMEAAAKPINQQAQHAIQTMLDGTSNQLNQLSRNAAQYTSIAHQSARRMAIIALVVGGIAGILGGLLAGLALGQILIS